MKRNLVMLVLATLSLWILGGCMQMHSDTVINKDGSGTASLTMSMSAVVTEAMAEMEGMGGGMGMGQDAGIPDFSDISKADMEKYGKDHGVKVKSFNKAVVDGRQTLKFELEFKDLEGLSYIMGSSLGQETGGGMGIVKLDDGNYKLQQVDYDYVLPEPEAEEEVEAEPMDMSNMDPAMMQKQMELMGKLMGAMAELDISMRITVPGEVISSNAHRVEGNTSIWEVTSDNAMTIEDGMEPEIVFSGKGLNIK